MGLSDGSAWTARSGVDNANGTYTSGKQQTVLDMRGSNPLSRSMKIIKVTMKEIYDAMKPSVEKNKKKYTRKTKHKNGKGENNK